MRKMMLILFGMMFISIFIGVQWDKYSWLKEGVHKILDPTFGALITQQLYLGMLFVIIVINFIFTGVQKLTVDPEQLKLIKEKQRYYKEEMGKYKNDPMKLKEVQMKQMAEFPEMFSKNFEVYMKPLLFTAIPIILFFRWFSDFFTALGSPKFFGFMSWFWFYLLASIFLSSPIRKIYKM